jgi:hypothetical protein
MESDIPVAKSEGGEAVAAKTTTGDAVTLYATPAAVARLPSNNNDDDDDDADDGDGDDSGS